MLLRPQVGLIDELHYEGQQLKILRRIYQSYELLIRRLLDRQKHLIEDSRPQPSRLTSSLHFNATDSDSDRHSHDLDQERPSNTYLFVGEGSQGVPFGAPAVLRFERLLDRIRLYALTQIDEWLDEKESLVFLVSFDLQDPRLNRANTQARF